MAGFEVVVRPVVLPSIRPQRAQSLPPQDNPDEGFAVIRGNGGIEVTLSNSYSANTTVPGQKERKREVDEARIYQKTSDGTINKENFVDIKVAKKIWMEGAKEPSSNGSTIKRRELWRFAPVKEKDNIEIIGRDKIIKEDTPED